MLQTLLLKYEEATSAALKQQENITHNISSVNAFATVTNIGTSLI